MICFLPTSLCTLDAVVSGANRSLCTTLPMSTVERCLSMATTVPIMLFGESPVTACRPATATANAPTLPCAAVGLTLVLCNVVVTCRQLLLFLGPINLLFGHGADLSSANRNRPWAEMNGVFAIGRGSVSILRAITLHRLFGPATLT